MTTEFSQRRVLAITSNYGVEQDELMTPVTRLRQLGAEVKICASSTDTIQTLISDKHLGREVSPDAAISAVSATDYDALLVPGGTINADNLRIDEQAVRLVRGFRDAELPVAAICHGPWLLVEADMAMNRSMTSYPSLRTDIGNAGGMWSDKSVVVDSDGSPTIITSRNPRDLDDFTDAIISVLKP